MLYREIMAVCSEIHTKHINTCTLFGLNVEFLSAFAKLLKANINFIMSVRPSILQKGTTRLRRDGFFYEIWYLSIFQNPVYKIQVSLIVDKNCAILHKDRYTFLIISRSLLLRMRNVSDKTSLFFLNCAFYEIMWKNIVELTGHRRQHNRAHELCMLDN